MILLILEESQFTHIYSIKSIMENCVLLPRSFSGLVFNSIVCYNQ